MTILGFAGRGFPSALRLAALAVVCVLALSGCLATDVSEERVPESLVKQTTVGEYNNIRFYSSDLESLHELADQRISEIRRAYPGQDLRGRVVEVNYLSLSGGGGDGAFGAGLLNGWTASGKRPKFDVVTGISTGALLAPFAFLGRDYDAVIKQAYTTISTHDVAEENAVAAMVGFTPSVSSSAGLQRLIARYLTPEAFDAIAREYRKGRMLLIGTTNLDAQRAVIWDIGAIAASGKPDSLALARNIILASASIPGVFPPVRLKVTANGKTYDEFHVDGGVTRQVFLFPPGYDIGSIDAAIGWTPHRHAYIVRNGRITPEYEAVNDSLLPVANRSISTLIKTQGVGDLYRIDLVCQKYNIDFNLAYISDEFNIPQKEMFDHDYMTKLFDYGYAASVKGYHWRKQPPGLESPPKS